MIETDSVPKSYVGAGGVRRAGRRDGPIGNRIIVLPQDGARARKPRSAFSFIDYVPTGASPKAKRW